MPDYKKYKCPVCNKQFKDGDDIVTCPECGTPHHRECYKLTGHCVNQGLHKSGYSFIDSEKKKEKKEEQAKIAKSFEGENSGDYYYSPEDDFVAQAKKEAQEKREKSSDAESNNDIKGIFPPPVQIDPSAYKLRGTIDGLSIMDIASTVRTNVSRFIQVFKKQSRTKKKAGWNWAAFFFGSFYLLFRKMYKQGVAFFCLAMTSIIAGEALVLKFAPKYVAAIQEFVTQYQSNPSSITTEYAQSLLNTSDMMNATKIIYAVLAILLILRIIEAMFADYFYKGTVANIIKKVTEQLENGATFTQTSLFINQDQELNQEQMRRMYLTSKGGVTLFAPFLAYFVMYILMAYI